MPRGSTITELYPPPLGARSDFAFQRSVSAAMQYMGNAPVAVDANNTLNVITRDADLVPRPGYLRLGTTTLTGRPMGGAYFTPPGSTLPVVATASKFYKYNGGTNVWDDITGAIAVGGGATQHSRFTVFPQGGSTYLLAVNGNGHDLCEYSGSGNFADTAGQAYRADDITTAANRIVLFHTYEAGAENLYRVRWSNFNDRTTWNANNFADLSDLNDPLVAGRFLSRVSFAAYGKASQWIGLAQAGLYPFKFEVQDFKPGPVSPAALIAVLGRHYYLAYDLSFYMFDGSRATHIGQPIRRWVRDNIGELNKVRTFAIYSRRDRTIYWIFPLGTSSDPSIGVAYQIDTDQWWPVQFNDAMSCGFAWADISAVTWNSLTGTWDTLSATYPTWDSFGGLTTEAEILGGTDGKMYRFGVDVTDNGMAPTAKWRFKSLQPSGASHRTRVQSLDTFFAETSSVLNVTTKIGTTDTLGAEPTFPAELSDTFDVQTDTLHQANYDTDSAGTGTGTPEARFIAVHHELSTTADWKWRGAHLRSYPQETS